jgi:hypothetical protein
MPDPGENIYTWATLASDNAGADSLINWAEGMPRADVNNSARSVMAAHAKWRNLTNGSIVTAGTANAQTFVSGLGYTTGTPPTGMRVLLKIGPGLINTGAATLSMDSLTAVAIKTQLGEDLTGGELAAGAYAEFSYDGANWILLHFRPDQNGLVFLESQIASNSATIDFTASIDDNYNEYIIRGTNVLPATDATDLQFRVSEDAGVSFKSGVLDYKQAVWVVLEGGASASFSSTGTTSVVLFNSQSNLSARAASFELHIFAPSDTSGWKLMKFDATSGHNTQGLQIWSGSGAYVGTSNAINAVRFFISSGNIASGTFTVYGVR